MNETGSQDSFATVLGFFPPRAKGQRSVYARAENYLIAPQSGFVGKVHLRAAPVIRRGCERARSISSQYSPRIQSEVNIMLRASVFRSDGERRVPVASSVSHASSFRT
jgi:hypothetical protein